MSRLHANTSNPDTYWREMTELMVPFGTIPQEHGHSRKGAKSNQIIQLNCRKVHTQAGYKKREHEKQLRNKNDKL